jgi:polyisoprenyl-phosphate glycosyltransferase
MPTISIITPCFNEESGISDCYKAVRRIFEEQLQGYEREHIFCDNASTDGTVKILKEIADGDKSVKIIINSRNFGILRNTFNGVLNANGDAILLFMPADLQDPPELIPEFVRLWEQGYEIVFGLRRNRQENFVMRLLRKIYYRVISRFSYVAYPADAGDFQLIDRKVQQVLKNTRETEPFLRMMVFDAGFRSIGVPYTWRARKHGRSRNNIIQLIDQGFIGLVSFSNVPLRLALFGGVLIASLSVLYGLWIGILSLVGGIPVQRGILTILMAVFFFGGVQLFFIGILGEYLLAVYNLSRGRPVVTERERVNFGSHDSDARAPSTIA